MSEADGLPAPRAVQLAGALPHILVVGNANVDVVLGPVAPWPSPGTEVTVDHFELRVGGAAGNTALALTGLGVEEGKHSDVVACVGDDAMGRWLQSALNGSARLSKVPSTTAITVCLSHPDAERTFVSYLGHLEHLPLQRLEEALARARPGDLLLLCGYFLLPRLREGARDLLLEAQDRGVLTLLDTGHPSEGWTDETRAEVADLLPLLDAFLPNREEALGVAGLGLHADLETAASILLGAGARRVIVKTGAEGGSYFSPSHSSNVAALPVVVSDTVGAGDTFNAGLLASLRNGFDWHAALTTAVTAASLAVSSSPRRYPSLAEVNAGERRQALASD